MTEKKKKIKTQEDGLICKNLNDWNINYKNVNDWISKEIVQYRDKTKSNLPMIVLDYK